MCFFVVIVKSSIFLNAYRYSDVFCIDHYLSLYNKYVKKKHKELTHNMRWQCQNMKIQKVILKKLLKMFRMVAVLIEQCLREIHHAHQLHELFQRKPG